MHKLAFVGFGVVGEGLAQILNDKREELRDRYGFEYTVVAVSDIKKGSAYNPDGLDLGKLIELSKSSNISGYHDAQVGLDALTTIIQSDADIVIEVTYTDIKTGQPAYQHFRAALESGKHLVTTNKGPTALFLDELSDLARTNRVMFRYEGTVMSGTPVLNMCEMCLAGNEIREIRGILNGTTNYILTGMEEGKPYQEVLKKAQELGYAEADPTADVEGYDAMAKVLILARSVMNARIAPSDVDRTGITEIKLDDIEAAKSEGKRWKLIGKVTKKGNSVKASVKPEKIDKTDPLASVGGATNALTFATDLLGDVTVVGAGAGKIETGYSLLADILSIHSRTA
jgi:homoserine dehydrogenase